MDVNKVLKNGHVFPLGTNYKPLVKWGTEAKRGSHNWDHIGHFGLATGPTGLVVLDIDNKNGKSGSASLRSLMAEHGSLPYTYTVETKSGGFHYYFKGVAPNTASKIGVGIDSRGQGGFVVIYHDVIDDSPIAELPQWLGQLLGRPADRIKHEDIGIEIDTDAYIEMATEYLINTEPAIDGEGGDALTVQVAMRVKDLGISEELCLDLMDEHWNYRCEPEWDICELEKKVKNAYSYGRNAVGSETPEGMYEISKASAEKAFHDFEPRDPSTPRKSFQDICNIGPAPKDTDEWLASAMPETVEVVEEEDLVRVDISKFLDTPAPIRKWIVKDWIPSNQVGSFYGEAGVGKSLAAVELSFAVTTGHNFYGEKIDRTCDVVSVSCEDDREEWHRRVESMMLQPGHKEHSSVFREGLHLFDQVGSDSSLVRIEDGLVIKTKFYHQLDRYLTSMGDGEKLVMLDTVVDVGTINENDRSEVNTFVKTILGGITKKHNATVIFLAHPSKSSEYSGSTAWRGSVRFSITLSWHDDLKDVRIVSRSKANYARQGEELLLEWDAGAFIRRGLNEIEEELVDLRVGGIIDLIKKMASAGNPLSRKPGASEYIKKYTIKDRNGCDIPFNNVMQILSLLITDGDVIEVVGSKTRGNGLFPKGEA